jgi:hypothetical protein
LLLVKIKFLQKKRNALVGFGILLCVFGFFGPHPALSQTLPSFSPKEIQQIENLLQGFYDFYFDCVEPKISRNVESNPGSHFQNVIQQLQTNLNRLEKTLSEFVHGNPSDALDFIRFLLVDVRDLKKDRFPFDRDDCPKKLQNLERDFEPLEHLQERQTLPEPQERTILDNDKIPPELISWGLVLVLAIVLVVIACLCAPVAAAAALVLLIAQSLDVPLSPSSATHQNLSSFINSKASDSCQQNCSSSLATFSQKDLDADFQPTRDGYIGWVLVKVGSSLEKVNIRVSRNLIQAAYKTPNQTKFCQSQIKKMGHVYYPTLPSCWVEHQKRS